MRIDLDDLGVDRGGHLLVAHALRGLPAGAELHVRGRDPNLALHLETWCRARGHGCTVVHEGADAGSVVIVAGTAAGARERDAARAGAASCRELVDRPPAEWGLAARGALVEAGGPVPRFALDRRDHVWAELVPQLYAQAAAAQWDPATAVPWDAPIGHPDEVEDAVVQVMTYLVENEQVALVVPARFLGNVHPYYREVVQLLAVQVADEARHVEVFTRRARLTGRELGLSTVGGRASLATLLDEPDFSVAALLLSVLGEGTFLDLLSFLVTYGPDPVTRSVARLALGDEARHVAFGQAHLEHRLATEPGLLGTLRGAIERRHDALHDTSGLNELVFDALVVLAAGAWSPDAIAQGHERVLNLQRDMAEGRMRRLTRLGFPTDEANELAALHTRNFM
jgi:hypothetical protein